MVLDCKNIVVTYILKKKQYIEALKGLSISFESGKVNIIFGENGCGKTTLFNCISGFLGYDGDILLDGDDIKKLSVKDRKISYVQQNLVLFPQLNIFDNLAFPLKQAKLKQEEITRLIYEILDDFKLTHIMNCLPNQISIGQFQKVMLAKALISKPKILILDEAFSNIDLKSKRFIQEKVKKYTKENDSITIAVEHDFDDALHYGDCFYLIDDSKVVIEAKNKQGLEEISKYIKNEKE